MGNVSSPRYYLIQLAKTEVESLRLSCVPHARRDETNGDLFINLLQGLDKLGRLLNVVDADMVKESRERR